MSYILEETAEEFDNKILKLEEEKKELEKKHQEVVEKNYKETKGKNDSTTSDRSREIDKIVTDIKSIKNKIEQVKDKKRKEQLRLHNLSESQLFNLNNVDIK